MSAFPVIQKRQKGLRDRDVSRCLRAAYRLHDLLAIMLRRNQPADGGFEPLVIGQEQEQEQESDS